MYIAITPLQSKTAAFFDLPYDRTQWMGEANLLQDVLDEKSDFPKGNIFDNESLFWIGYTYRTALWQLKEFWKVVIYDENGIALPFSSLIESTVLLMLFLKQKIS